MKKVEIFTDGACRGNPGPGGYGVLLRYNKREIKISGGEAYTTNNRMELQAVICGLTTLKEPCLVEITTDSQYVHYGITKWLSAWKKHNWRIGRKNAVKNVDLWQKLEDEAARHKIKWHWIRGHNGHRENEIADALARAAINKMLQGKK